MVKTSRNTGWPFERTLAVAFIRLLLTVAAVVPCDARSVQRPDASIRLNTVSGKPVVDGVLLNGQGPYRFLLDTGARTNRVAASIAHKLGLAPTSQVELSTADGRILIAVGRVAELALGSARAFNQEFLFTPLDGVHALSAEIQGVLGQEFLARFDYLLDFANHRLVFGELAPKGGSRVGIEMIDGRPAIETSEGKLVLSSGTNTVILFRAASSPWDGRVRIGGHEYHIASAAYIPRASQLEGGELPVRLFQALFVSNSGKYAILDPGAAQVSGQERVTVCVSGLPDGVDKSRVVLRARFLASRIYAEIGVTLDWKARRDCSADGIEIVWSSRVDDHPGATGYTFPDQGIRNQGARIVVFYNRLCAGAPERQLVQLLGHVMAHEIGHVLQGVDRHSETGVMKARFTLADCTELSFHPLSFTNEDANLIHLGLVKRALRMGEF